MLTAVERRAEHVLAVIAKAARDGLPCPDNTALGNALGVSHTMASEAVARLRKAGAIKIIANGSSRIVEVVATGERTAGHRTRKDRFAELLADGFGPVDAGKAMSLKPNEWKAIYARIVADLGWQAA